MDVDSENEVKDVCEAQFPVVTVVVFPFATSTMISSSKISKLSPNASGLRLK